MIDEKRLAEIEAGARDPILLTGWNTTALMLVAEVRRLREALEKIAYATGAMPAAVGDEASWFRSQFYGQVAEAARALKDSSESR